MPEQDIVDSLLDETMAEFNNTDIDSLIAEANTPATPYQKYAKFQQETGIPGFVGGVIGGPVGKYIAEDPSILINSISDIGAGAGTLLGGGAGAVAGGGAASGPLGAAGAVAGAGIGGSGGAYLEERIRQFLGSPPESQLIQLSEDPTLNDALNTVGFDVLAGGVLKGAAKGAKAVGNKVVEPMLANFPELDRTLKAGKDKFIELFGKNPDALTPANQQFRGEQVLNEFGKTAASRQAKQDIFDESVKQEKSIIKSARDIFDESDVNLKSEIKQAETKLKQAESELRSIDSFVEGQSKYPIKEINKQITELEKQAKTYANNTETGFIETQKKLAPLYQQKSEILTKRQQEIEQISKFRAEQEDLLKRNREALEQNKLAKTKLTDQELALQQRRPEFEDFEQTLDSDFLNKIVKKGATPEAKDVISRIVQSPETVRLSLAATRGSIKPRLQEEVLSKLIHDKDSLAYLRDNEDLFKLVLPTGKEDEAYKNLTSFFDAVKKHPKENRIKPVEFTGNQTKFGVSGNFLQHGIIGSLGYVASGGGFKGLLVGAGFSMATDKLIKAMATNEDVAKFMIKRANGVEDFSKAEISKFLAGIAGAKIVIQAGGKKKSGVIEMTPTLKNYGSGRGTINTKP